MRSTDQDRGANSAPATGAHAAIPPPVPGPRRPPRYPLRDLSDASSHRIGPLPGVPYLRFLDLVHERLRVRRYIEIGARTGKSLAVAQGSVVAVDPHFAIKDPIWQRKSQIHLFQMTSDDFFAQHDPKVFLGGPADLAFVDGMHHYEYALRDFMNCEAHCGATGAVMLHDCVPGDFHMARRLARLPNGRFEGFQGDWTGDVWRVLRVLARWRPELRITLVDSPPTGLAIITGLDPASTLLRDNLPRILAEEDGLGNTEPGWWDWAMARELLNGRALLGRVGALAEALGLPAAPT